MTWPLRREVVPDLNWTGYEPVPREAKAPTMAENLVEEIRQVVDENPMYGLCWTRALVRRKMKVNRKKVHRILKRNGWCHRTAIIDCYERNIVGWRLSKTGVAKVAAAALEEALRTRGINPEHDDLTSRSDNGFVFGAKPIVAIVNCYVLDREYITPYTPEQNG